MSAAAAAKEIGISEATAYRINKELRGIIDPGGFARARAKELNALPSPRPLTELSTDALAALGDFNLFGEMYFARVPSAWRLDAARRIGDAIADKSQRTFLDMNVFPGAGKTTLGHDVMVWLICGGHVVDPAIGRSLRLMWGSRVMKVSKHNVLRIRRSLELTRPFYDKDQRREAAFVLQREYGRFRPDTSIGEESKWSEEEILVAQLGSVDLYEKEPTLQAASQESGFLGERVDFAWWDDLTVTANSTNPEVAAGLDSWFENEGETRVEPGGVMCLVGQRLTPLDLHRKRLDVQVEQLDGTSRPLYEHIIYPAHWDRICDGTHRQWNPTTNSGCLTDSRALPEKDWLAVRSKTDYRTVYQQEEADPGRILVQNAWLTGGTDHEGFEAPGCYDRDRGFWEWPADVGRMVNYATLDPSAGNWWACEWWAIQPDSRFNYLIEGRRSKIQAGKFLDWDESKGVFTGWMHEMQVHSYELGQPIRVWTIEAVAAHKYLFQFEHFRRWRAAFPNVAVISHETQRNKLDPQYGVEGLMSNRYRTGMKRLPKKEGYEQLSYLRIKERELTTYPFADTDDTVMADWVGEWNLDRIISMGRRPLGEDVSVTTDSRMPKYLKRQQRESALSR